MGSARWRVAFAWSASPLPRLATARRAAETTATALAGAGRRGRGRSAATCECDVRLPAVHQLAPGAAQEAAQLQRSARAVRRSVLRPRDTMRDATAAPSDGDIYIDHRPLSA